MGFFSKFFGGGGDQRTEALKQVLTGRVIGIIDPSEIIRRIFCIGCQDVDVEAMELDDLGQAAQGDGRLDALLLDAKTVHREDAAALQQVRERHPGVVVLLLVRASEKPSPGVEEMPGIDGIHHKPFKIIELLGAIAEKLPQR